MMAKYNANTRSTQRSTLHGMALGKMSMSFQAE